MKFRTMQAGLFAEMMEMQLLQPELSLQEITIEGCYIGDLLSHVMGSAQPGQLWLTIMNSINVLAVAHLIELPAIVLLENVQPVEGFLERATMEGIPVFLTADTAFDTALRFYHAGMDHE